MKTYIQQAEAIAAVAAYYSMPDVLRNRHIIHFIDNTTALSSLIHGYASKPDMARITNAYYVMHLALGCYTWLEWVPSGANIADLPSRGALAKLLELFESLGIAQPKGVILYGPPGTGKTLLARAVAHHTDCCFIRVSGSELVQKYIGEGARMVRELFVMARENAPAILFMDEVDSIGSARGSGGGDSEVQRTMLELLNQLDGFEASNQIKVIMATNRLDILDAALLRPGRIDRKIEFPNPTEDSRVDILKIHSRKMNLVRGIDLKKIASKMGGASGAESKAVCTEAGMFALRERRVHVTQEDFEMAVAKVMQKDSEKNVSVAKLFT